MKTEIIKTTNGFKILVNSNIAKYLKSNNMNLRYDIRKILLVYCPKNKKYLMFNTLFFKSSDNKNLRRINVSDRNDIFGYNFDYTIENYKGSPIFSDILKLSESNNFLTHHVEFEKYSNLTESELELLINYLNLLKNVSKIEMSEIFKIIQRKLK